MNSENLIVIDGHEFAFTPGETILQVAQRNGIDIPTLCFLKGATPTGACRICVVELDSFPRHFIYERTGGFVISITSEMVISQCINTMAVTGPKNAPRVSRDCLKP